MRKIVVTGGPQSGKSSFIKDIQTPYEGNGCDYNIFTVPETASQLILGSGLKFSVNPYSFQRAVLALQLEKEREIERAICAMIGESQAEKSIMLLDRGALDGKAYVSDKMWNEICADLKVNGDEFLSRYHAVIYLESVTKVDKNAFSNESNPARYEDDPEQADALDNLTYSNWKSHSNFYVVKAQEDFEVKKANFFNLLNSLI